MSKRIGLISESNYPQQFNSFKGYFVNPANPNYPSDPSSPNYPRKDGRISGYQNPLLGDPGWGEIARWQKVKTNALETLVDQMIEQYTRDRRWYSNVRCRESLWNMYRRLEWWVNQNTEPGDADYQNALSFIRDCIVQILDPGERPKILHQHKFKDGFDNSFNYNGDWFINEYGNLSAKYYDRNIENLDEVIAWGEEKWDNYEPDIWTIVKTIEYPSDGLVTFNYAINEGLSGLSLYLNNEKIWEHDSSYLVGDRTQNYRDITLNIPKGINEFRWEYIGDVFELAWGNKSELNITEVIFTELMPEIEKPDDLPKCPLPYTHHFSSDYYNQFNGEPHVRPTFSTVGGAKVSDYLDMIRYVSSKENIEWVQIKNDIGSEWDETIFKLPLERLPETLSSKMTFNWRLKRKGYITFKYWVDGGNGSELLFYINNQLVGGPWRDTDGWQEISFNMSQPQTYKFDFLVHKSVSKDLGTNAVYIKDIEVVEVTDYDDEPMPGDYYVGGEEAEEEYGKWLIYSQDGVLATYYRGFPDDGEDTTRELELEFYSECDGVFSFEHRLGTNDPDRYAVEGIIFTEPHGLEENPVVWDGEENGVGIPSIKVFPSYGSWKNVMPDGYSDVEGNMLWTKDSDSINYKVKIDGDWDRGAKYLDAYGRVGVICPPKHVVETDYLENLYSGRWFVRGAWQSLGDEAILEEKEDIGNYGYAVFEPHEDTRIMSVEIDERMKNTEVLNIYSGGYLYRRLYPGFENIVINIPNFDGDLRFEVESDVVEDEKVPVFSGVLEFDGEFIPMEKETMYEKAGEFIDTYYEREDGRERRVFSEIYRGSLESPYSWYTNDGFDLVSDLLPGDELHVRIPNAKVPYVDYARLESMIEEYKEGMDPVEPVQLFYEDFNPFNNRDRFIYSENEWQVVDIFPFLNIDKEGDNVIVHDVTEEFPNTVEFELSLDGLELQDGGNYLSFEYGALFREGDYVEVAARTDNGNQLMRILTQSSLVPEGRLVQGLKIPDDASSIIFSYHYGGGFGG